MNKLFNKVLAVAMVGTMVVGANVTALAADVNSATGTGESTGHLKTDVVTAILPTQSVDSVFAFTIDPENILEAAGKIKGGSTAVTANDDKVYFVKAGDTPTYGSTSDAVKISAKNYVAADVSVKAEVGDAAEGKTIIPLADSAEALEDATVPTLLLTLKVGSKSGAITSEGVTVTDQIAAQNSKFNTEWDAESTKYVVKPQEGDDVTWNGLDVQMAGKLGGPEATTDDVVAPTITLTWTVGAHVDNAAPSIATTSYTLTADTALAINVNLGAGDLAATAVTGVKNGSQVIPADAWSYNNGVLTFTAARVNSLINAGVTRTYTVIFNDTAGTTVDVVLDGSN